MKNRKLELVLFFAGFAGITLDAYLCDVYSCSQGYWIAIMYLVFGLLLLAFNLTQEK